VKRVLSRLVILIFAVCTPQMLGALPAYRSGFVVSARSGTGRVIARENHRAISRVDLEVWHR
jgi:hypothetical protein